MPQLMNDFEKLMEHVLEEQLFAWLPAQMTVKNTIFQITSAISAIQESSPQENLQGDFLIQVAPEDYPLWYSNQMDLLHLSRMLVSICQGNGHPLEKPPAFHILANPNLAAGRLEVLPIRPMQETGETQYLDSPSEWKQAVPINIQLQQAEIQAFLTNSENVVYPLTKPVTNIGRREENDIVINDQRVSRQHAQIRRSNQHFMIFDLNSTGGTYVNNRRVTQTLLISGDVISIAGNLFIYAEEVMTSDEDQTRDLNSATSTPEADLSEDDPEDLE